MSDSPTAHTVSCRKQSDDPETNDNGATWNERSLDLPGRGELSPDQHRFQRRRRLDRRAARPADAHDRRWPELDPTVSRHETSGEPYLITALGPHSAELATNVGAVYATQDSGGTWEAKVSDAAGPFEICVGVKDGGYVSVSSLGNFYATWETGDSVWQVHQRVSSQRLQSIGYQPDGQLWMVARGAQIRLNDEPGNLDSWSKAIIPITNGYGYMDMAWDADGAIWAGGGNGTLLVSRDGGDSWEIGSRRRPTAQQLHPHGVRWRTGLRAR